MAKKRIAKRKSTTTKAHKKKTTKKKRRSGRKTISLVDFLLVLGEDLKLLAAYQEDPDAVIGASALSAKNKALLRRKDAVEIREALGEARGGVPVYMCVIVQVY